MSSTPRSNNEQPLISAIREQLYTFEALLKKDASDFDIKMRSTRQTVFHHIDQQIERLRNMEEEYQEKFVDLEEENRKTCAENQSRLLQFSRDMEGCVDDESQLSELLKELNATFHVRPTMLANIPTFNLQDIHIDLTQIVQEKNQSIAKSSASTVEDKSPPGVVGTVAAVEQHFNDLYFANGKQEPLHLVSRSQSPPAARSAFVPVKATTSDEAQEPSTSSKSQKITEEKKIIAGSMGHSHHKQFAPEINTTITMTEGQSRTVSTCSTITGPESMVRMLFQISYPNNRVPLLMTCNPDENSLLIYIASLHKFDYVLIGSRQISRINLSSNESLLTIGYSTHKHRFYFVTEKFDQVVFFRISSEKIDVEQTIPLSHNDRTQPQIEHIYALHLDGNYLMYIFKTSSSGVMFGRYDLDEHVFEPPIDLQNKLYDETEGSSLEIIDFSFNVNYINLLTRAKNRHKYILLLLDHDMNKIYSFDLIDAKWPLSIVSTSRALPSVTTTTSEQCSQPLLFINDLKAHLIHCCTQELYLIPIQVNGYAICPLNDGNLALVAKQVIRGLDVQDFLKQNNIRID